MERGLSKVVQGREGGIDRDTHLASSEACKECRRSFRLIFSFKSEV
jgi:hypothetical protein